MKMRAGNGPEEPLAELPALSDCHELACGDNE
jgi:hypothetical protein